MKIQVKITVILMLLCTLSCIACSKEGGDNNSLLLFLAGGEVIPDAPGAATLTPGNAELSLAWTVVSGATAYEVWYSDTDNSSTATEFTSDPDDTDCACVIDGLTNGVTYYVWIKAKNNAGTSDFGPASNKKAGVYTVTYSAGAGDTAGTVPVDASEYIHNSLVTVLDNTGNLSGTVIQDGIRQRFVEWNTQFDGNGTAYAASDTFTITGDTTLYAIYTVDSEVLRKVGPAGGWVFYDAGSVQTWGQYLEAANANLTDSVWGTVAYEVPGADETAIGTGYQNTQDIVDNDTGTLDKAADRCADYSVEYGGQTHSNWFLPSRYELEEMHTNLKEYNVGGFDDYHYWSSSENGDTYSISIYFINGSTSGYQKDTVFHVRPIRAF